MSNSNSSNKVSVPEAKEAMNRFRSKETMLDDTVSRNLRLWEKEMTKSEEKS